MPARVAAGRRLGQAEGRDLPPLRLRNQVALLLILGAPRQQRQAVQADVHGEDHAQRRVHVLQFLAREAEADVVGARCRRTRRAPRRPAGRASAICGRMAGSKRCWRSSSRMRGATSRPPTRGRDCSSSRCSSVRSKFMASITGDPPCGRSRRRRAQPAAFGRARAVGRDFEVVGAAEEGAHLSGRHLGVSGHQPVATSRPPACSERCRPCAPAGRRSGRSMFVIRLPKRSTRRTSPRISSGGHARGRRWGGPGSR